MQPNQEKTFNTQGISSSFRHYYCRLYNLSLEFSGDPIPTSLDDMQAYISEMALPKIHPQDTVDMDKPLFEPEFLGAIKGLKIGKCPWARWVHALVL